MGQPLALGDRDFDDALTAIETAWVLAWRFAPDQMRAHGLRMYLNWRAGQLAFLQLRTALPLYLSVSGLLLAINGYWWTVPLCLPLSLAGAHHGRAWLALRYDWATPIVVEAVPSPSPNTKAEAIAALTMAYERAKALGERTGRPFVMPPPPGHRPIADPLP